MTKLVFSPDSLRRGFAMVKLVKPVSGDITLKVYGNKLVLYTYDRRRYVWAEVESQSSDTSSDFVSDDFYVSSDRQSLFDTDLSTIIISLSEKSLSVRAEGGGQVRSAAIKRRAETSRRPPVPVKVEPPSSGESISASHFDELLRQVSCSALVRETKSDEDMKVNQVHFYPEHSCAFSDARYYATIAKLPGINLEFSIISSDIPIMRTFCSKVSGENVIIHQNKTHLFIIDPVSDSRVFFSKVASKRPPLVILSEDDYDIIICADQAILRKNFTWSAIAVEGTQRLSLKGNSSDGFIDLYSGTQEISRIPISFVRGSSIQADFPIRVLSSIVGYLGDGKAILKYKHKDAPFVLEIAEEAQDGSVRARHFVNSMRERQ